MPHPIHSHIIGTVMLAMLSMVIIASIAMIVLTIQYDVMKTRLQEAAENIASIIVEVVSLTNSSSNTKYIVRELYLPKNFEEKEYIISLGRDDSGWHVEVYLSTLTWVKAKATLTWINEAVINVYDGGENPLNLKIGDLTVYATNKLRSGRGRPLVWCEKDNNGALSIGLGYLS